jgi:signal transduction histidine kinase
VIAGALSIGLGAALVFHRLKLEEEERIAPTHEAASTSWYISQVLLESQRFSRRLESYELQRAVRGEVETAFEVFWSRINIVLDSRIGDHAEISAVMRRYEALLERVEPVLPTLDHRDYIWFAEVQRTLAAVDAALRKLWVESFTGQNYAGVAEQLKSRDASLDRLEAAMIAMLAALVTYMVVEIAIGARGREREAKARAEAERASAARGRFLANMSHELQTPLNGVLGIAALLLRSGLSERQRGLVTVIQTSAGRLGSVIRTILNDVQIETGEAKPAIAPFDPAALALAVGEAADAAAARKGLALSVRVAPDLPAVLLGDADRLSEALGGLLDNAIKFTAAGFVELRVGGRRADGVCDLAFEVEDSGPSVPEAERETIFEAFNQGAHGDGLRPEGTGLGLAICRMLADGMGGAVRHAPRADGAGSVFALSAPLPVAEVRGGAAPRLDGIEILLADPRARRRESLAESLRSWGAVVTESAAPPGRAAAGRPDCVTLASELIGRETTARWIIEGGTGRNPPVILVTAPGSATAAARELNMSHLSAFAGREEAVGLVRETLAAARLAIAERGPPAAGAVRL